MSYCYNTHTHTLPMVPAHMWLTCLSSTFKPNVAHGIFCFHALIRLIRCNPSTLCNSLSALSAVYKLSTCLVPLMLYSASMPKLLIQCGPWPLCNPAAVTFYKTKFHLTRFLSWFTRAPIRGLVDFLWFSYTDLSLSFVYSAARLCGVKYFTRDFSLSKGRGRISTFTIWRWLSHSAGITSHLLLRSTWILPLPSDPGWWERRPWERRPPDEGHFSERERSRSPRRVPQTPPGPRDPTRAVRTRATHKLSKCNGKARLNLLL